MERNYYNLFLILLVFFCGIGLAFENAGTISGKASIEDVFSNVSINQYYAIDFSENVSEGILFGTIQFLPADDVNATHNYDGVSNSSSFYANVSTDSNVEVDFCIRANDDLITSGGDRIGLANETYAYYNVSNSTHPLETQKISLNTTYDPSGLSISIGGSNYWRFWLDVPAGQSTGLYNNTVQIKGMETGAVC